MDEIIMRRLRHLQWLEDNHEQSFQKRPAENTEQADRKREELTNVVSAAWHRNRVRPQGRALPRDWRKEHWKTLQAMALDYAGVGAASKAEAINALEAYEADLTPPPAA
ncbi:hypothetical protein ABVF61_05245 [Roseibium sp. HPY-6]|uniref:hypothetical protein n=1 Tax=Roseibium sp. HPY-6 TaxID=3229852 RepID=UPI00338FFF72